MAVTISRNSRPSDTYISIKAFHNVHHVYHTSMSVCKMIPNAANLRYVEVSTRVSRGTLLLTVLANGVEDFLDRFYRHS